MNFGPFLTTEKWSFSWPVYFRYCHIITRGFSTVHINRFDPDLALSHFTVVTYCWYMHKGALSNDICHLQDLNYVSCCCKNSKQVTDHINVEKPWSDHKQWNLLIKAFMLQWDAFLRVNSDGFSSSITVLQKTGNV